MYRAVLDTCALVPGLQRDFLLELATQRAYMPLWGTGILFEFDYVLERLAVRRGKPDQSAERRHMFEQMARAFPGSSIEAAKTRVYDYGLTDVDDGHVAHAAIVGKADAIVTDDRRAGFRTAPALLSAEIETVYPHEFAANTVAAHPAEAVRALQTMSARFRHPPATANEILVELADRYRMTELPALLEGRLREPAP